jgi:subtilisin
MVEGYSDNGEATWPATPSELGPLTPAQASIGGLTGRYLVLLEPKGINKGVGALSETASIALDHVAPKDDTPIDARSIDEGRGLLFPELGVAVVNPAPDQVATVSATVAASSAILEMEPERFVYATPFDAAYMRGFRDAVNHLYEKLVDPAADTGVSEALVGDQQFTWGLIATRVNATSQTGQGVRVAVLDTGIDLAHPDLQGRVTASRSFIAGESVDDGNGPGTHTAGTACGPRQPRGLPRYACAIAADLLVGKVLGNSGRGTDSGILAGIQWALDERADIISMSLGSPVAPGQNYSAVFEQVGRRAIARGTLIIAAAGNDSRRARGGVQPVGHPANCPSIMGVGAVDRNFVPADFSNGGLNTNGGKVDLVAPGVDVRSSWPGGQYRNLDGTSMAAPHVAGIAALWAQTDPTLRGDALWARLIQMTKSLGGSARDVGAGLVQAPQ